MFGVAPSSVEVLAQSRGNIPSFGAEVRFLRLPQYLELTKMKQPYVPTWIGRRKDNGAEVKGYAARGTECDRWFILVPVLPTKVSIVEVDPDTMLMNDEGD